MMIPGGMYLVPVGRDDGTQITMLYLPYHTHYYYQQERGPQIHSQLPHRRRLPALGIMIF